MIVTKTNAARPIMLNTNRHKNILIIGEGYTDFDLNKINYYDSVDQVEKIYGISQLSNAFKVAKTIGCPHVFVANIKDKSGYIDIIDILKYYDFTYLVPIGIKFSDKFYNPFLNRDMTYSELLLRATINNSTLILMTDSHASLYEDVDDYLIDMLKKINAFKTTSYGNLEFGRNIGFVSNNLKNYDYSNVVLASILSTTKLSDYPSYNVGEAIFDIDDFDIKDYEMIYFKNNDSVATSIENLKNFRIEQDAAKLINIDRVIKFIERELDWSDFKGKIFSEYVKLNIYERLTKFLNSQINSSIRNFKINSVNFIKNSSGAGIVVNSFSIVPMTSIEEFNISMEV